MIEGMLFILGELVVMILIMMADGMAMLVLMLVGAAAVATMLAMMGVISWLVLISEPNAVISNSLHLAWRSQPLPPLSFTPGCVHARTARHMNPSPLSSGQPHVIRPASSASFAPL